MSTPLLGEVRMFAGNFAPRGWALCNGQILPIAQNTALFSLLGTTYGGNGQTTFALPNLQSRTPMHAGQGAGLSPVSLGESGGSESVTLTTAQLPAHTHQPQGSNQDQTTNRPGGSSPARGGIYADPDTTMAPTAPAGGSQPHENRSPYLALNFIIALEGIYPSRN